MGGIAGAMTIAAASLLPGVAAAAPVTGSTSSSQSGDAALVAVPANARYAPPLSSDLCPAAHVRVHGRLRHQHGQRLLRRLPVRPEGTWRSLGLAGSPDQAAPSLQDAAAAALEQTRGWVPWPACSSHLGLVPRRAHGVPATQVLGTVTPPAQGSLPVVAVTAAGGSGTAAPTSLPAGSAPTHTTVAPPFQGHVLTTADASTYRSDVRTWQSRMSARGWNVTADGYFGPAEPGSRARVRSGEASLRRPARRGRGDGLGGSLDVSG